MSNSEDDDIDRENEVSAVESILETDADHDDHRVASQVQGGDAQADHLQYFIFN